MHHAGAGNCLEQRLNPFPSPEGEHGRSHCPGVQANGAHIEEVTGDAVQLAENDPHILGPFRHGQAHQFFHGLAIDQLIVKVGHIVQPVKQGNYLMVLLAFAELFRTPVQVADVGFHINNFLSIDPQHHPKHTVGGGMLRPHVEQHLNGFGIGRWVGGYVSATFYHLTTFYSLPSANYRN